MSRSGYTDDYDDVLVLGRWRGRVASAMRGARGQKLLRDLRDALDAMPVKRLIADELETESGEHCALGVLGAARGIDMKNIDPDEPEIVGDAFGIASCMAQEIVYENDEQCTGSSFTPEKRWKHMREFVDSWIIRTPEERKIEEDRAREIAANGWVLTGWQKTPHYNTHVEISEDGMNVDGTANYLNGVKRLDPKYPGYFDCGPGFATDGSDGKPKDMILQPKYWRYPRAI